MINLDTPMNDVADTLAGYVQAALEWLAEQVRRLIDAATPHLLEFARELDRFPRRRLLTRDSPDGH